MMAPIKEGKHSPENSPPSTASSSGMSTGKRSLHSQNSDASDDVNNNDEKKLDAKIPLKSGSVLSLQSVSTSRSDGSRSMRGSPGGFWSKMRSDNEINFVKALDEKYECCFCRQVLRYPVQLECGHHVCNGCIVELMRVEPRCPIDQMRVERGRYISDRRLQKEIETLMLRCSNMSCGCSWTGYLRELPVHLEQCELQLVSCPNECTADFERRFLAQHLEEDCPRRQEACKYCSKRIKLDDMQEHFGTCKKYPIACPNKCGADEIIRDKLSSHMEQECVEQQIQCPFFESGCSFKAKRRELKGHIMTSPEIHMEIMVKSVSTCTDALEIHDAILERQAERLAAIENQVSVMEKMTGTQVIWKIDNYNTRFQDAVNGIAVALQSPVFEMSKYGYRFSLSVCLNGDAKVAGSFMSLYVSLHVGDYDALLEWPFDKQLTISLLDQAKDVSNRKDYAQTLSPNPCPENMVFLKRPLGTKNSAFGLVKFIELDKLKNSTYLKNNLLFIGAQLEGRDMKKI